MKIKAGSIKELGDVGEAAAAKYLKKNKYKIIARNLNEGKSEIDIIAEKDDNLVFVEVKTRSYDPEKTYYSRPADAVNKSKRSYLIRGADRFCAENGAKYADYFKRFDIIEVYFRSCDGKFVLEDVKHFENAIGRNN